MSTINNQDEVTRLTLKKTILKTNSRGELETNSFGKNELCFKGLKDVLGVIIEDLEVKASYSKEFSTLSHNDMLIILIEEVCYSLATDVVRHHEGTVSLKSIYERCFQTEGRNITKIYLDDELQKNHTVLPIKEIMTLRDCVTSSFGEDLIIINYHRRLFIYLYLARQKLLVTND